MKNRYVPQWTGGKVKAGKSVTYFLSPDYALGSKIQAQASNLPNQLGNSMYSGSRVTLHSLFSGDRILVASDGISKVLSESEIAHIMHSATNATTLESNLLNAAMAKGLLDDYGLAAIFIGK